MTIQNYNDMKKYMTIFLNWRLNLLMVIGMASLIFLAGDTEDMSAFIWSKAVGLTLLYTCYRLGKYWDGKGKFDDLKALADED